MSISALKLANYNEQRKQTARQISTAISQLNAQADIALKQQAYMRSNPDANGADELIAVVAPEFNTLSEAFNQVAAKLQDMQAVNAGTMAVDELIAKYSSINLTEFSNGLI